MATDTQIKTYSFYSRGDNELLIRSPKIVDESALGRQRVLDQGCRYSFAPSGRLTVYEGQDQIADGPLDPATLQPTVQDAVTWLRNHPKLNLRFWEDGREPDRPLPTEQDFLAVVTSAVAALDPAPIEEALAQERESHNRTVLLDAASAALKTVLETRAALEREQGSAGGETDGAE